MNKSNFLKYSHLYSIEICLFYKKIQDNKQVHNLLLWQIRNKRLRNYVNNQISKIHIKRKAYIFKEHLIFSYNLNHRTYNKNS
jgi:hypothetical protein